MLDVVRVRELVAANHQRGGDLFESCIAGTLADAIDGALHLSRSALNAGERVGDCHAEVVVAVRRIDDVFDAGNALAHHAEDGFVFGWRGVADGVGNIDRGRSSLNGDGDHLDEKIGIGARAVFGRKLDVVGVGQRQVAPPRRSGRVPVRA